MPCLGSPLLRDLQTSAARIPDAVTTMVCGAPGGFVGVGFKLVHCCFRKVERLSRVRDWLQLVLSRTVLAAQSQCGPIFRWQ